MRPALSVAIVLVGCSLPVPGFIAEEIDDRDCPEEGTELTYDNFGEAFMQRWCVGCHGGIGGISSRSYTSLGAIRAEADRIYINAAGPNKTMPPGPDDPPEDEREALAEWLVCGAP